MGFRLILKETSKNKTCLVPGPVPCIVEVKRCRERTLQRESWLSVSREGEGGESLGGLHSTLVAYQLTPGLLCEDFYFGSGPNNAPKRLQDTTSINWKH